MELKASRCFEGVLMAFSGRGAVFFFFGFIRLNFGYTNLDRVCMPMS